MIGAGRKGVGIEIALSVAGIRVQVADHIRTGIRWRPRRGQRKRKAVLDREDGVQLPAAHRLVKRFAEISCKHLAVTERHLVDSAEYESVADVRIRKGAVEPEALVDLLFVRERAAAIVEGLGERIRRRELQAVRETA